MKVFHGHLLAGLGLLAPPVLHRRTADATRIRPGGSMMPKPRRTAKPESDSLDVSQTPVGLSDLELALSDLDLPGLDIALPHPDSEKGSP